MEAKKNPKADLQKKRGLFFNIGLALTMACVISAFEWKSIEQKSEVSFNTQNDFEMETLVPITEQVLPKPKVEQIVLIEVPNEEEVEEEIKIDIDAFTDEEEVVVAIPEMEEPEEEEAEQIHVMVQSMPMFDGGGSEKFLQYASKRLKYPSQARRMGIQGKVFVQFVVDKTGEVTNVEVIRGIGGGCDEEALRVIKESPKWTPGKQRGNAVKVRMLVPITFRLD